MYSWTLGANFFLLEPLNPTTRDTYFKVLQGYKNPHGLLSLEVGFFKMLFNFQTKEVLNTKNIRNLTTHLSHGYCVPETRF